MMHLSGVYVMVLNMDLILCACGCGNKIFKYDNKGRERKFISGHNIKGKTFLHKTRTISTLERKKCSERIIKYNKQFKGKSYEERFGVDKAKEIKNKLSLRYKGKSHIEIYGEENTNIRREITSKRTKGKTFIEIYGPVKAKQINEKHSSFLKGKTYEQIFGPLKAEELRLKKVKQFRGRHLSDITKNKMRLARLANPHNCGIQNTSIEVKIQEYLKQLEIPFFTHQTMNQIKHSYQCDILIPCLNMVIECDGDYWHNYPIGNEIDHIRTSELIEKGFKVLRLWEIDIKNMDLNSFKKKLQEV